MKKTFGLWGIVFVISSCGDITLPFSERSAASSLTPKNETNVETGKVSGEQSVEFAAAFDVIVKNCASCHAGYSQQDEASWQASGMIVPGSPENSPLYQVLYGSASGNESMPPQSLSSLTSGELEVIAIWIKNSASELSLSPAEQRWKRAQFILQSSCVSCHAQREEPHFEALTEDELVDRRLVTRGRASGSKLYKVMIENGGDVMPPAGMLEAEKIVAVREWIDAL